MIFLGFKIVLVFGFFANQSTVHSGGVGELAGGGSMAVAVGVSDR